MIGKPNYLPLGPKVVPFWGSYVEFYKVIPKKELLWGLWVGTCHREPRPAGPHHPSVAKTKKTKRIHRGGCQNYGPFWGTLNIRCRVIIRTPKGTRILTITHIYYLYPKCPCTQVVYTSPQYLYRDYFKAKVCAIWVHGPLRLRN